MRALIFVPDRDSPGRHDATGAFIPEGLAFAKLHRFTTQRTVKIDVSKPRRARMDETLTALRSASVSGKLDVVAVFCHGLRSGLQVGPDNPTVHEFARAIADACTPNVRVALYACSTGAGPGPGGDGGFADKLRDALCQAGARDCAVFGHDRAGHCTELPYVRAFDGMGSPVGGCGGRWVVAPGSPLWKPWVRALKGDLRLSYPLLSVAEVHHQLLAATGDVA
ncbi:MAG TPA: hypothetical protein VHM19_14065 [Polyangiales bacterium]|nr:hypothetical protein [Polyangiales bacterium]